MSYLKRVIKPRVIVKVKKIKREKISQGYKVW